MFFTKVPPQINRGNFGFGLNLGVIKIALQHLERLQATNASQGTDDQAFFIRTLGRLYRIAQSE